MRIFFAWRFGTPEPEFTLYAGPDAEALAAVYRAAAGREIGDGFRDWAAGDGEVSIVALDGAAAPPYRLDWHYQFHVRADLAPWDAMSPAPGGRDRRGPEWLSLGVAAYAKAAYRAAAGIEAYDDARSRHAGLAAASAATLAAVETQAGVDAAGAGTARALGFLAAERLVAVAGEPALFEYYRLLPASANWQAAFEAAFGIAVEAFHADFEAYRAIAAPGGG